ncbi:MAG: flagellar biosynthetic protein FliO [Candidatus Marinimicrobia bacterium]|nr:flagellar biosynthetic protein FliO [Candidatus Neomarinimicrobiota bacterium]
MKFKISGPAARLIAIGVVITITIVGITMRGREIKSITSPSSVTVDSAATQELQLKTYDADGLTNALYKTVFVTMVIVAIIVLGSRGLRQYRRRRPDSIAGFDMQILGRRYFNTKQSIALVRVRDKELLLGITDHSIQLLCDLTADDPAEVVDRVIDLPLGR